MAFGHDAAGWCWENPAPTVGESTATVPSERWVRGPANDPEWPASRPATTLAGDPRVPQPGHKNDKNSPDCPGRMEGSIRLEPVEALLLQSFPPDHPVQGGRSAQFQQIGDAVPPLLAAHCVAMATGIDLNRG